MKFIATRPFKNVRKLAFAVEAADGTKTVPAAVQRGDVFNIGTTTDFNELARDSEAALKAQWVLHGNMAICMDDTNNKGRLETLQKQITTEREQVARDAKKAKAPTMEDLVSQIAVLSQAVAKLAGVKS